LSTKPKYSINKITATITVITFLIVFLLDDPVSISARARAYINTLFFGVPITGLLLVLFPKDFARSDAKNWVGKPSPPGGFYRVFGWFLIVVPIIVFIVLKQP